MVLRVAWSAAKISRSVSIGGWHGCRLRQLCERGPKVLKVNRDRPGPGAKVLSRTRPLPILRSCAQPAANRIGMDVRDLAADCLRGKDVAVVPTSPLPEPKGHMACRSRIHHDVEPFGRMLAGPRDRALRDGLLDRGKNRTDAALLIRRIDQQVHVRGHRHPCPEVQAVPESCLDQRIHQPLATALRPQERVVVEAGERQGAGVVLPLDADERSPARGFVRHSEPIIRKT